MRFATVRGVPTGNDAAQSPHPASLLQWRHVDGRRQYSRDVLHVIRIDDQRIAQFVAQRPEPAVRKPFVVAPALFVAKPDAPQPVTGDAVRHVDSIGIDGRLAIGFREYSRRPQVAPSGRLGRQGTKIGGYGSPPFTGCPVAQEIDTLDQAEPNG